MAANIYTTSDAVVYDTAANVASSRPLPQTPASAGTGVTQPSTNIYAQIATSAGTSTARGGFTKTAKIVATVAFASVVMGLLITFGISIYSLNSHKTAETEMGVLWSALTRSRAETASLKAAQEIADAKLAKLTGTNEYTGIAAADAGAAVTVIPRNTETKNVTKMNFADRGQPDGTGHSQSHHNNKMAFGWLRR